MATQFISYENALLDIEGQTILANTASLGVEAALQPVVGITGQLIRYAPQAPIKGTLSFTHYCTGSFPEFLNPINHVDQYEPLTGSLAGVVFSSGYVRSLSFSVAPFQPIQIRSELDIYGELTALNNAGDEDSDRKNLPSYLESVDIGHGLRSFLAGDSVGINNQVSFDYSVSCSRNPVVTVGNELPYRVTKENIRIDMTVEGNDLGGILKVTGNQAGVTVNIYDVYGASALSTFGCTGQINNSTLNASADNYIRGSISLSQEFVSGRRLL